MSAAGPRARSAAGFSLIELALVLVGLSLVLGGLLGPIAAHLEARRLRDTERELARVHDALLGFALSRRNRLPCPDADGDGVEDRLPAGECRAAEGGLPWVDLGAGREDAWGRRLRYRADRAFTAPGGAPEPPDTTDGLAVRRHPDGLRLTLADPHAPSAIVFSCGANGRPDGANRPAPAGTPSGCDGAADPDPNYTLGVPGEGFDDVLIWLSKNVLLARLVAAGSWPPSL